MSRDEETSTNVINDVNKTLYRIFRESLDKNVEIIFGSPADEEGNARDPKPRLYVFLYNIVEDAFQKNDPDIMIGGQQLFSKKAPLAVNLFYMLTPVSEPAKGLDVERLDDVQAHTIIAQAMRALYDNSILSPTFFPSNSMLSYSTIRMSRVPINMDEVTKIWSSFNKPLKLSVCYEVSTLFIQSSDKPRKVYPTLKTVVKEVEMAATSGNGISAGGGRAIAGRRGILDVKPDTVQPGMALSIFGNDLAGLCKKFTVKIDDRPIDSSSSLSVVDENFIRVKVPIDETPGTKHLSIHYEDTTEEFGRDFEVQLLTDAEAAHAIKISELRPQKGAPGDLISVIGANFSEDISVTIGGMRAAAITFVDNAQINIMIPQNMKAGAKPITVKRGGSTYTVPLTILDKKS